MKLGSTHTTLFLGLVDLLVVDVALVLLRKVLYLVVLDVVLKFLGSVLDCSRLFGLMGMLLVSDVVLL